MEAISTVLTSALGYVFKAVSQSKVGKKAENEILGSFWTWIRPRIIGTVPEIEVDKNKQKISAKVKSTRAETENKTQKRLIELSRDESFFKELSEHVGKLKQAGIKEKNIFKGNIENVKTIRIGDKNYSPDESYDRKNVFEGNVQNSDEFNIGDGH